MDTARGMFEPIPTETPPLPGIESTPERIELGKMLYFEPRLSESHAITCNSCHIVGMGGVDMLETSIGHRWQSGRSQRADRAQRGVQHRAVLGWPGQGPRGAGGRTAWSNPIEMASTHESTSSRC